MITYQLTIGNSKIGFLTLHEAQEYRNLKGHPNDQIETIEIVETVDYSKAIHSRLSYYQSCAANLINDLYVQNQLSGITTEQSDQMFDEYSDVLLRIREGAFPTALHRLQSKAATGFVTQELLNSWLTKIQHYIDS